MNNAKCILELEEFQAIELAKELEYIDNDIHSKVDDVIKKASTSYIEALEYIVTCNVVLWAKVYLNWEARDYQEEMLLQGVKSRRLVLRLGRRLGKTEVMCVLILWYAYTQRNRASLTQYDILIVGPYETQVDLIFARLLQLIEASPILSDCIEKNVQHKITLTNGTVILGKTGGASSGGSQKAGAGTRGLHGDVMIMDEVDYIGSAQITNIVNILNDNPETSRLIVASTPSGKREEFYKWCVNASRTYFASEKDIKNYEFNGFEFKKNEKGNGWTTIYAPSIVNKKLLEINKDTNRSYLEDLKYELSEMRFVQEVMAEFGEEELGIYQKRFIDKAINEGRRINHKYIGDYTREEITKYKQERRMNKWMLGIDWDKVSANTNFVCVEYDRLFVNEFNNIEPKFKVLFRVEIPRGKFTFTEAVDKIIHLNDLWDFDYIAVDRGYGETQIEMLHKYGIANPQSGLEEKVVGYHFSQNIDVYDPHTREKDSKPLKPYMVNNSVIIFERGKIVLNPDDNSFIEDLEGYRLKGVTSTGAPIYSNENEHTIDAMNLCLLIFEQNHGTLFKDLVTAKMYSTEGLNPDNIKIVERRFAPKEDKREKMVVGLGNKGVVMVIDERKKGSKRRNSFKRSRF